jgi:hypothetical protein
MTKKPSDQLRGAAFYEAGHVVVARFLGLRVDEIEIGMNGDDASGRAAVGSMLFCQCPNLAGSQLLLARYFTILSLTLGHAGPLSSDSYRYTNAPQCLRHSGGRCFLQPRSNLPRPWRRGFSLTLTAQATGTRKAASRGYRLPPSQPLARDWGAKTNSISRA